MSTDGEAELRDWSSLPLEILDLIVSKMGVSNFHDITNFRVVCKLWRRSYYPKDIGFNSQWLAQIVPYHHDQPFRMFHPMVDKPITIIDVVDGLSDATPRYSKDGWVLMSEGHLHMFFFNPCSNSTIKLPDLPSHSPSHYYGFAFTSTPASKDCQVFALAKRSGRSGTSTSIFTTSRGENWWRETIWIHGRAFAPCQASPVYLLGNLYCMNFNGHVHVFDLINSSEKNHLRSPYPHSHFYIQEEAFGKNRYILDFNGKIIAVNLGRMQASIKVCEWDETNLTWQELDDLGEYTLFLSDTANSFAKKSTKSCMKNKIFLPKFRGNYMVFYSLKDDLFGTFENDIPIMNFTEVKALKNCCWMEPTKYQDTRIFWVSEGRETEGDDDHVSTLMNLLLDDSTEDTNSTISSEYDDDTDDSRYQYFSDYETDLDDYY